MCSKARLAEYGLDDAEDSVANFLILSLQNDQMSPALQVRIEDGDNGCLTSDVCPRKPRLTTRGWRPASRPASPRTT